MGTLLNVILVVEKTYQYFISLKLIQNYALFLPFHNETQNNSNIEKKTATNKVTHLQKENKTVQETKTKRCIKFLDAKTEKPVLQKLLIC